MGSLIIKIEQEQPETIGEKKITASSITKLI